MFCNNCGKEIKEDAVYCNYCGHQVKKVVQLKRCQICGAVNENEKYCRICGSQLDLGLIQQPTHPSFIASEPQVFEESKPDKYGQASMVISIVSLSTTVLCCMFPFGIIGGVISFIFGLLSRKSDNCNNGKSITGIVCGSIAAVLGVVILVFIIIIMLNPDLLEAFLATLEESGIVFE